MKRLFEMMGGLLGKKTHTQYMQQAAQALAAPGQCRKVVITYSFDRGCPPGTGRAGQR